MNTLWQDLRFAMRTLAHTPGFALVAVLALALGTGANSAAFSMVHALLLRPLEFAHLDRMVWVWGDAPKLGIKSLGISAADLRDFQALSRSFTRLEAWRTRYVTLGGSGDPENLTCAEITPGWFAMLSTAPALGRTFRADEAQPGADGAVLLGHGLWVRRFGADPTIVGRTVPLDGRPCTIAGVMSRDFDFPKGTDLWTPFAPGPELLQRRDLRTLSVVGLMAPGVSRAAAEADLDG
ncbi:MAG TPA: ABC transporter permease, partial [Dongiaceae bacterium]|nr:ABC transporter permease [Dongiaceae bacterium]